jgi:hypothetical protein
MNVERQPNLSDLEISFDSLSEYLRRTYPNRLLSFEYRPELLDELIAELRLRDFLTIGEVHKTLERTKKAVELFEKDVPPNSGPKDSRYSAIGIVRMSMLLLDDDFFTFRKTILNGSIPEKLEKYRRYILPETNES